MKTYLEIENLENSWVLSDTHFYHKKIVEIFNRKNDFSSVERMNDTIIKNWNSVVNENDIVFHLGDFSFNFSKIPELMDKLNGTKILVLGNHDLKNERYYKLVGFKYVSPMIILNNHIILTHIPIHPICFDERWKINIHGHLHEKVINDPRYFNVSVENINYFPINLKNLIKNLNLFS